MHRIFYLVILVAAVSCKHLFMRNNDDYLWKEFKQFFNKNYTNNEDSTRKSIWQNRRSEIITHNSGFHSGSQSYSLGINDFSDMSDEDFMEFSTGLEDNLDCKDRSLVYSPPENVSIPESIDWIKRGFVTNVVNQGPCGACWAFCCAASLEGQLKRMTGKLVKLSEQHLIDCSTITGNKQCSGGQMCRAYEYAATVGGVELESTYPFESKGGKCKFRKENIGANVTGYLEIPYGDEQALLMAVALIGPVAAGVHGLRSNFRHYKSGIYDDPKCDNVTLNHAVTIVGYGTENGKDYWLVKNSWGLLWGENGFGKMVRNKNNQCGLASSAIFPVLSVNDKGEPILDGPRAHK